MADNSDNKHFYQRRSAGADAVVCQTSQAKGQNESIHQNHSEHTPLAVSAYKAGMAMVI